MAVPSAKELDSFKYGDLRNLAKSLGLRANLKADKLLKSLKAHLKLEARKESNSQDEKESAAFFCDETETPTSSQEQAGKEPVVHVTKRRRRRHKRGHGKPNSQDHSEIKISDPTTFQNGEKQEDQDPKTPAEIPSQPDQGQGDGNMVSTGQSEMKDNEDLKEPSEKKSRFTDGFSRLANSKKTAATTPNFKKLHEAHFKEMESIDEYIKRKRKHFEEHNSFNELKKQPGTKGRVVTPVPPRGRLPVACTPTQQCQSPGQSRSSARKSTVCLKGSVKRTTLSATKMNVRFSAATKDNEHKRSLTKTPARKSLHVSLSGINPKSQAMLGTPKLKNTKENSASVITPFKLTTMAVKTPVSDKKPVFDLKASLSRPLNYEPHKGKLKPWGQSKENNSLSERASRVSLYKKSYKQPPLQTREEQRKKQEQERKEKKAEVLAARRGLKMVKNN
ncbi:nucleolar and spindle-associated protein 1 isoform X3 [Perognathus longimembris pacificus]|uniref:nucleolar and spindle-associated protein 1 isoform X3 n=1 Tax=Perognathus longimembris pacificus TaxID=214514 RepID=UPI002018ACD5|nr:nucleolar and spindle-associated protein 1 isoform X3 [Perognathus longimembris pacificus]